MITFRQKEYTSFSRKVLVNGKALFKNSKKAVNEIASNPGKLVKDTVGDALENPINGTYTAAVPGGTVTNKIVKPVTDIIDKPLKKVLKTNKLRGLYDKHLGNTIEGLSNGAFQQLKYAGGGY